MKYIGALLVAGGIYMFLARPAPQPVKKAVAAEDGTDFLKEPLDRTHAVLDQAKKRAGDPALQ
jgi:hypothetical protein